jgi:hypothetical protein
MSDTEEKKPGFWGRRKDNAIDKTKKVVGWAGIERGATEIKSYVRLIDPRNIKKEQVIEEFEESCARFSVDKEKLHEIYDGVHLQFYCATMILALMFLWMLYLATTGDMFPAVIVCAVTSVPMAIMATLSFRLYQLSKRRWCEFGDWLADSSAWWPISWAQSEEIRKARKSKASKSKES